VAVLFDEDDAPLKTMQGISFIREGAFSGDLCAGVNPGISGPGELPRIGHAIPGWDFEIVEKPQRPGQYRWLQFAWKPLSPDTKAMAVLIGWQWASGLFAAVAGAPDYDGLPDGRPGGGSLLVAQKVADAPPADWQVVRVDLWKLKSAGENIKPGNIRCLGLVASGGGMAVDSILLGKNEADLPPIGR